MTMLGESIGPKIIEALGLPKHCKSVVIDIRPGMIVTIQAEYYPDTESMMKGITKIAEYELHEKKD